jgi:hypothetical protein
MTTAIPFVSVDDDGAEKDPPLGDDPQVTVLLELVGSGLPPSSAYCAITVTVAPAGTVDAEYETKY